MAWLWLCLAGALEVVWAVSMKQSQGFTKLGATLVTLVALIASFAFLSMAMKTLPLGTAYPIWTGIGALGSFAVGALAFNEPTPPLRLLAAALVLGGVLLLKGSQ